MLNFHILGFNHKNTPLPLREKVHFSPEKIPHVLQIMKEHNLMQEGFILSTCNRTEFYLIPSTLVNSQKTLVYSQIKNFLAEYCSLDEEEISHHYYHNGDQAILHLMRVASGLDSMIIGEPQVLGQVKQAVEIANGNQLVGKKLRKILAEIISAVKKVRANTAICLHPLSLGSIIHHLSRDIYTNLNKCSVLCIGNNKLLTDILIYIQDKGLNKITMINRSLEKAETSIKKIKEKNQETSINVLPLQDLEKVFPQTDIVISATSCDNYMVDYNLMQNVIKKRRLSRPLLLIDLAVPRDFDPEIRKLSDIYLYDIDDLKNISYNHQIARKQAVEQANILLEKQLKILLNKIAVQEASTAINAYRKQIEQLKNVELKKAINSYQNGANIEKVLECLAESLANKIMHSTTMQIRRAAISGQNELMNLIKSLYTEY